MHPTVIPQILKRFCSITTILIACYLPVSCVSIDEDAQSGKPKKLIEGFPRAEYEALQSGDSSYFAKPFPSNRIVDPQTVQSLSIPLNLSAGQISKLESILTDARERSLRISRTILTKESQLKALFHKSRRINRQQVSQLIMIISRLKGRLRLTHLDASLKTKRLLSVQQFQQLVRWHPNATQTM